MGVEIAESANLLLTLVLIFFVLSLLITIVSIARLTSSRTITRIDRSVNNTDIAEINSLTKYRKSIPAPALYAMLDRDRPLFINDDGVELISGNVAGTNIDSINDLTKVYNFKLNFVAKQVRDGLYSIEVSKAEGFR